MALGDQQGTLREKFNRVGGWDTFVRTETETEDAGSFGHHRRRRAGEQIHERGCCKRSGPGRERPGDGTEKASGRECRGAEDLAITRLSKSEDGPPR